jgi:hypothetical protein
MRAGDTRRQTRGAEEVQAEDEGQDEEEAETRRGRLAGGKRKEKRGDGWRAGAPSGNASGKGAGEVWAKEAHQLSRCLTSSTSKPPCLIMRFT